jgi:hypothetical protein
MSIKTGLKKNTATGIFADLYACSREVHDVLDVLALAANHCTNGLFRDVQVHHLQLLLRSSLVGTHVVRRAPIIARNATLVKSRKKKWGLVNSKMLLNCNIIVTLYQQTAQGCTGTPHPTAAEELPGWDPCCKESAHNSSKKLLNCNIIDHCTNRLLMSVQVNHLQLLLRSSLVGTHVVRRAPIIARNATLLKKKKKKVGAGNSNMLLNCNIITTVWFCGFKKKITINCC